MKLTVLCLFFFAVQTATAETPGPTTTSACSVDTKKMQKEAKNLQKLKCELEQVQVRAAIEAAKRGTVVPASTPEVGVAPATQAVTTVTTRRKYDEKGHMIALEGSKEWKKLESLRVKKNAEVEKAKAYSLNPCAASWLARPSYCFYGYGGGYVAAPYSSYGGRW